MHGIMNNKRLSALFYALFEQNKFISRYIKFNNIALKYDNNTYLMDNIYLINGNAYINLINGNALAVT
jgi:hypothetical protein